MPRVPMSPRRIYSARAYNEHPSPAVPATDDGAWAVTCGSQASEPADCSDLASPIRAAAQAKIRGSAALGWRVSTSLPIQHLSWEGKRPRAWLWGIVACCTTAPP